MGPAFRPTSASASSRSSSGSPARKGRGSASGSTSPTRSSSRTAEIWEWPTRPAEGAASGSRFRWSARLVLLALAVERRGVDPQHARCVLEGGGARQHAQDVLALHLLDGEVSAHLRQRPAVRRDAL